MISMQVQLQVKKSLQELQEIIMLDTRKCSDAGCCEKLKMHCSGRSN